MSFGRIRSNHALQPTHLPWLRYGKRSAELRPCNGASAGSIRVEIRRVHRTGAYLQGE